MHGHGYTYVHVCLRGVSDLRMRYQALRTVRRRSFNRNGVVEQRPGCPAGASGTWTALFNWLQIMRMFF